MAEASITKITSPADRRRMRAAFDVVFATTDPFDYPFQPGVEACIVFYPTDLSFLTRAQYDAVLMSARDVGDTRFLLSLVEFSGDWVESGDHWSCEFPSHEAYERIERPILENALYSPAGKWGALISHEDHAIVGGSRDFVRQVEARYPGWRENWRDLLMLWEDHPNGAWVNKLKGRITTG